MTFYKCENCDAIHRLYSDAAECCPNVAVVEICPKCGKDYPQDEYPCCYVDVDKREGHPDKEMWDKWDEKHL